MNHGKLWFVKMIIASSYVVKDMLRSIEGALDKGDFLETRNMIEKFSMRYAQDTDLQVIYRDFQDYMATRDKEKLRELMAKLKELIASRKMGTPSTFTGSLWYSSTRPGTPAVLRAV